jgi:hypothetical protein
MLSDGEKKKKVGIAVVYIDRVYMVAWSETGALVDAW